MHRTLIAAAILLSIAAPAAAEDKMVVDMSKMTCAELTKLGFQDFAGITMWMSGYYNASVRSTVIDLYEFAQAAKTVARGGPMRPTDDELGIIKTDDTVGRIAADASQEVRSRLSRLASRFGRGRKH